MTLNLIQLGQRIKQRRQQRNLRQADIASALQISAQAVSKWERGENAPDIALLVELARLLDVSIEWLLGGIAAESDTFDATVFCTSLNGYAERSAKLTPRELAAWSNTIHFALTEAIHANDGVPIKYVGDGFLGFFSGAKHAERALKAAHAAHAAVGDPGMIILLHCGDIFLGSVGHPDYQRPDIIGQAVNTAFLAMPVAAAKSKNGIVITSTVLERLESPLKTIKLKTIDVLGRKTPLDLFEPEQTQTT